MKLYRILSVLYRFLTSLKLSVFEMLAKFIYPAFNGPLTTSILSIKDRSNYPQRFPVPNLPVKQTKSHSPKHRHQATPIERQATRPPKISHMPQWIRDQHHPVMMLHLRHISSILPKAEFILMHQNSKNGIPIKGSGDFFSVAGS
jgi:hypothetical protein